jgi:hypothetical protein
MQVHEIRPLDDLGAVLRSRLPEPTNDADRLWRNVGLFWSALAKRDSRCVHVSEIDDFINAFPKACLSCKKRVAREIQQQLQTLHIRVLQHQSSPYLKDFWEMESRLLPTCSCK